MKYIFTPLLFLIVITGISCSGTQNLPAVQELTTGITIIERQVCIKSPASDKKVFAKNQIVFSYS
jgi:hypothetical protein